jgi:hypothetical protein
LARASIVRSRLFVIIAAGVVVLGGAAALYYVSRTPPARPAVSPAAPAPVSTPAPASPVASPPVTAPRASAPPKPAVEPPPAATAEAAPTTGTLLIESDVPDTSVFLDRVFLGTAPVTARDVAPGQHRLNLSATGYDSYADTIDVAPGLRTVSISFREIRLDESLPVVHKHALGSCTGTLRATPQGLTYETANKGDAFSVPLTDLETFTLDYLAKNLRVKVKGDRLYFFHQAVDKVRQRLIGGR